MAATGVAPIIVSSGGRSAMVGAPHVYDPDNTAEASGTQPVFWSATTAPAGFGIDATAGLVVWTPGTAGSHDICITATNAFGSDDSCFAVLASGGGDGPPVVLQTANARAAIHLEYVYDDDRTADVLSSLPVTWSKVEGPGNFRIDARTGRVVWKSNTLGTISIVLRPTNSLGAADYGFDVQVSDDEPLAPTAVIERDLSSGTAPLTVLTSALSSYPPPALWRP